MVGFRRKALVMLVLVSSLGLSFVALRSVSTTSPHLHHHDHISHALDVEPDRREPTRAQNGRQDETDASPWVEPDPDALFEHGPDEQELAEEREKEDAHEGDQEINHNENLSDALRESRRSAKPVLSPRRNDEFGINDDEVWQQGPDGDDLGSKKDVVPQGNSDFGGGNNKLGDSVHTCPDGSKPVRRLVWIKTHKTGSSTVTNILHRHALKRGLSVVLPRDELFLGWPDERALARSILDVPNQVKPYDILCSAHARYSHSEMGAVVPDAAYITLLRDPVRQSKSSWDYWQVPRKVSVDRHGGKKCETVKQILTTPECEALMTQYDHILTKNSQAFDLGLSPDRPEDVHKLIEHLDSNFFMILITEYLDESLLLLKRKMCWDLEDIVYFSLKVNTKRPSEKDLELDALLRARSPADVALYAHFNATLWNAIAKEDGFAEELAKLRTLKDRFTAQCDAIIHAPGRDVRHLQALIDNRAILPEDDRQCHLALLDSPAFVRYFKFQLGIKPADWMPRAPQQKIVWIKTHKTGSSTMTNVFHRYALKHKLRVVLPRGDLFLGWPTGKNLLGTIVHPLPGLPVGHTYDIFCSAHHRYYREGLEKLIPGASYITLLRHPVTHFLSSWSYWGIGGKIGKRGGGQCSNWWHYLQNVDACFKYTSSFDQILLHNSQTFDLGLAVNASREDTGVLMKHLQNEFAVVLITEYMDESLVLMKRKLNWDIEDVVYFSFKVSGRSRSAGLPDVQQQAILEFNNNDWRVYQHMNKTLWAAIEREVGFFEEVAEMRKLKEKIFNQCQGMTRMSEDMHLRALVEHSDDMTPSDQECHEALLDSKTFSRYLKLKAGIPPGSWCARPPQKRIALLWAHGAGTTLPNILHRFAIKHHARIAIPRDGSNLGWPVTNTETFEAAVMLPERRPRNINFEMLFSGHIRFGDHLGKFVPHAKLIALLRDPVTAFLATWSELNMHDKLQPECRNVVEFVARWTECIKQASSEDQLRLQNTAAYDLGINLQDNRSVQGARGWISRLDKEFSLVLIDDRMDESLIMLKRIFCFEAEDIEHLLLASDEPVISPATREQLQSLSPDSLKSFNATVLRQNGLSDMYYRHFDSVLSRRAEREVAFNEELAELRQRRAELTTQCAPFASDTQEQLLERALKGPKSSSPSEFRCATLLLTKDSFLKYFTSIGSMLWKIRGVRAWCACLLVDACEGQHCVKFG
eukprot:m.238503 g.238503  ORF g.238503 m.238503 type:complete len:1208 (-) comp10916_c0_seq14:1906-5529(-)